MEAQTNTKERFQIGKGWVVRINNKCYYTEVQQRQEEKFFSIVNMSGTKTIAPEIFLKIKNAHNRTLCLTK